jgi:MFS family permease
MLRRRRLLVVAFIESFATIFLERGAFFYAKELLGFSKAANLGLALAFGAVYVAGALVSHSLSRRLGEKPLLTLALGGQWVAHLALTAWPASGNLVVWYTVLGAMNGLKWPVIESYIAAGHAPSRVSREIGKFNLAWASAVPLSLLAAGPLIAHVPWGLFAIPAVVNAGSLLLTRPLAHRPAHLPDDHPERLDTARMARAAALLWGARWLLLCGYAAMWVLAAVLPHLLAGLGLAVAVAAGVSGLLDLVRLSAFAALRSTDAWHGRRALLYASAAMMPAGFFLIFFAGNLPTVLAGEVLFGLGVGMAYYASLYYGMVVRNAAVDAGGAHEGLIGGGFALGPIVGLAALALAPAVGGERAGILLGIGPMFLLLTGLALRAMHRPIRDGARPGGFRVT